MTCAKIKIECWLVHPSGVVFYGSNDCANPQVTCPRGNAPKGTEYEKCQHICQQEGHAEQIALKKAGHFSYGCIAFVNHDWICPNCADLLYKNGVEQVYLAALAPVFWQNEVKIRD